MKIGELELKVGAPDPERLLERTGQRVAGMRRLLGEKLIPGLVAAALHACLAAEHAAIEVHDLAVAIEEAGVDEIRIKVRKLFGRRKAASPAAADGAGADGGEDAETLEEPDGE